MLLTDISDRFALANYGVAGFVMLIGIIASARALEDEGLSTGARRLCLGLLLVSTGFAMHQWYWFVWKLLAMTESSGAIWFVENAFLLTGPYGLIFFGGALVAHSLFRNNCLVHRLITGGSEGPSMFSGVYPWIMAMLLAWATFFFFWEFI